MQQQKKFSQLPRNFTSAYNCHSTWLRKNPPHPFYTIWEERERAEPWRGSVMQKGAVDFEHSFSFSRHITCIILTLSSGSMMSRGRPYWTVPALTTPPASANRLYCMPGENLNYLHSVFRMDPHWFGSPRSGSGLGMRIRIQEQGNRPKLTNKRDFQPSIWHLYLCGYVLWHLTIFQVKIQLFVTEKSAQESDPHWFVSLDPDPHWNQRGSETLITSINR